MSRESVKLVPGPNFENRRNWTKKDEAIDKMPTVEDSLQSARSALAVGRMLTIGSGEEIDGPNDEMRHDAMRALDLMLMEAWELVDELLDVLPGNVCNLHVVRGSE